MIGQDAQEGHESDIFHAFARVYAVNVLQNNNKLNSPGKPVSSCVKIGWNQVGRFSGVIKIIN